MTSKAPKISTLQSSKHTKIRKMTLNSTLMKNNNSPIKLDNSTNQQAIKNSNKTLLRTPKSAKLESKNFGSLMISYSQEENSPSLSKSAIFIKRTSLSEICSTSLNSQKWLQWSILSELWKKEEENSMLVYQELPLILML